MALATLQLILKLYHNWSIRVRCQPLYGGVQDLGQDFVRRVFGYPNLGCIPAEKRVRPENGARR
jgi:hypothetical protein